MIKNKTVAFVIFVLVGIAIWNICELIYTSFITKSGYQFDATECIGKPALLAVLVGYALFLTKKEGK